MPQPHVGVFMMDPLHHRCLGFHRHPVVKTPTLDRLKRDAVDFNRCCVQNSERRS